MLKKTVKIETKLKIEVSRIEIDNDHVLITYDDYSTETRLV